MSTEGSTDGPDGHDGESQQSEKEGRLTPSKRSVRLISSESRSNSTDSTKKRRRSDKKSETWEVEKILREKFKGKEKWYLVKWVGFSNEENTWEPEENIASCEELLQQFQESKTNKGSSLPTPRGFELNMQTNVSFESHQAQKLLGAHQTETGQTYLLVKWKAENEEEEIYSWVESKLCRKHVPDMLFDFYEQRLKFASS